MVRLKGSQSEKTLADLKKFQFLMVRLKVIGITTIKKWWEDFNSLWCD